MHERRRGERQANKKITINGNTVSKIIFYKKIAIPVISLIIGLISLLYITFVNLLEGHKVNLQIKDIQKQIQTLQLKAQQLKEKNMQISKQLSKTKSYMIDTQKLLPLLEKTINLLKIKHLIQDLQILEIKTDKEYQNVVDISLAITKGSKYLTTPLLAKILKLVLSNIFYIKDIYIKDDIIHLQIYKKVDL